MTYPTKYPREVKVAVVVITHNGKHHLKECLEALLQQTYKNFETYLIDNGSTDGSADYVREHFPWVRIIRFRKNYGFAGAYNRAITIIDTEYAALLNDDTKVDSRWLEELVKEMEKDDKLFAVGSKLLLYDNPSIINYAGAKITPLGGGFEVGFGARDGPEFNKPMYTGAACGAAMLVRREIFLKLGGFDTTFFAYAEDSDLCWRAWLAGYRVKYVPSSVVYHKFGGSWGKISSPPRIYLGTRNRLLTVIKNFESHNVVKAFISSLAFDLLRIVMYLMRRNKQNAIAILYAYKAFFRLMPLMKRKRSIINAIKKLSDRDLKEQKILASFTEALRAYLRLLKIEKNAHAIFRKDTIK